MMISPNKISSDSFIVSTRISVEPRLETTFAVQYWNTSANRPAAGSTIWIEVIYNVLPAQLMEAAQRLVLGRRRAVRLEKIGVGPQPVAVLGSTAFVVAPSST